MKKRFRLIRRNERGGKLYLFDTLTGKRESLKTPNTDDAQQIVHARNEAERQPIINKHIAKAYLVASDSAISTRTWQNAFDTIIASKKGETQARWQRAAKEKPFGLIRNCVIVETQADQLLAVLNAGGVSTNVHLRKLSNFCLDMGWLPWPIIPKKQWPKIVYGEKRAITLEEHQKIIGRERNPERRSFYELCWEIGGSQGDVACLHAEDIDWTERVIAFKRKKTTTPVLFHFGEAVAGILKALPKAGPLFPYLITLRASDRATEFKQRCETVGVSGVTLDSFRYALAERMARIGYSIKTCTDGPWSSERGHCPGLCQKSTGEIAEPGRIRTENCATCRFTNWLTHTACWRPKAGSSLGTLSRPMRNWRTSSRSFVLIPKCSKRA
jgi:integrase